MPSASEDTGNSEYGRTTPYQLCPVPMLVQSFSPLNLAPTLSQSLQQYSQIIDDMINQRVFTEHATSVLSQMLKNADCDLATNYVSAINTMLTIGNSICDCGNTYITRLKEKKVLLSQRQESNADIIGTIDSMHNTLVDLLSQARSLDMTLSGILQMLTQLSIPIQPGQVQQLTRVTDLSLPVGVTTLPSIPGYQPNLPNQACFQIIAPVQPMIGNRLVMPQQVVVSRVVASSVPENVNAVSYRNDTPSQRAMAALKKSHPLSPPSTPSISSIQPSVQSSPASATGKGPAPEKPPSTIVASSQLRADSTKTVRNKPSQ